MAYPTYAHEYRKNAVAGASPLQMVVMLYDGALRHMEAGRHAIAHQDYPRQNEHLQQAQRILMELMSCLDMEKGEEISHNLMSLYDFTLRELVRGNLEDDASAIALCIRIFSDLRESWVQLAAITPDEAVHAA